MASAQESQARGFVYFQRKSNIPAYFLSTEYQPRTGKRKKKQSEILKNELKKAAKEENVTMIEGDDIDVEIIYARRPSKKSRADIDNLTRLLVNGLEGIAYDNDNKVRTFSGTFIDLNRLQELRFPPNYVETIKRFALDLMSQQRVIICIYSDSQLEKLNGAEKVARERAERCSQIVDERIPPERRV